MAHPDAAGDSAEVFADVDADELGREPWWWRGPVDRVRVTPNGDNMEQPTSLFGLWVNRIGAAVSYSMARLTVLVGQESLLVFCRRQHKVVERSPEHDHLGMSPGQARRSQAT